MKTINFATTNDEKFLIAKMVCEQFDLQVSRVVIDVDEIQGEDPLLIVKDKADRAYKKFKKPIVVSDDSWNIPALKGFPGPYMKSINHWFSADDFLRLMDGIEDRSIILHQYLAYNDGVKTTVFRNDINGKIIYEIRGNNIKSPTMSVIALDEDNDMTLAEVFEKGQNALVSRYKDRPDVWHQLVKWYLNSKN